MQAELGDKVKCKVTGFTGIVIGKSKHLYGCDRVGVQPPVDKDGKALDAMWADIDAVEVLEKAVVKGHTDQPAGTKKGGPLTRSEIPRTEGAPR